MAPRHSRSDSDVSAITESPDRRKVSMIELPRGTGNEARTHRGAEHSGQDCVLAHRPTSTGALGGTPDTPPVKGAKTTRRGTRLNTTRRAAAQVTRSDRVGPPPIWTRVVNRANPIPRSDSRFRSADTGIDISGGADSVARGRQRSTARRAGSGHVADGRFDVDTHDSARAATREGGSSSARSQRVGTNRELPRVAALSLTPCSS